MRLVQTVDQWLCSMPRQKARLIGHCSSTPRAALDGQVTPQLRVSLIGAPDPDALQLRRPSVTRRSVSEKALQQSCGSESAGLRSAMLET